MTRFCTRLGIGLLFTLLALNVTTNILHLSSDLVFGVSFVDALPQASSPAAAGTPSTKPDSPSPAASPSAPSSAPSPSPSPSPSSSPSSSDGSSSAPSSGGSSGSPSNSGSSSSSTSTSTDTKPSSQPSGKPTSSSKPRSTITLPPLTHTVTTSITTTITSISTDVDGNSMPVTVTATAAPGATSLTAIRINASPTIKLSQKQCAASRDTCQDVVCPGHKIDFRCELTIQCTCRPLSDDDLNSAFAVFRTSLFNPWSTKASGQFDHTFILLSLLVGGIMFIMVVTDDLFVS